MDEQEVPTQIDPAILKFASFKGRYLAGKYGFGRHDAEDIQHELLLDYLKRLRSLDAHHRRCEPFRRLLISRCIATMIEAQRAARRDYRVHQISLDQPSQYGVRSSPELIEVIEDNGSPFRQFEASLNPRLDVERFLRNLPAELRCLCGILMQSESCVEAATIARISRATLYRRIRRIQEVFIQAGLQGYLGQRKRPVHKSPLPIP